VVRKAIWNVHRSQQPRCRHCLGLSRVSPLGWEWAGEWWPAKNDGVLACSGAGCAGVPGVAEKSQEFAWRRVNAWLPLGMPAFWSAGVNCEPETTRRRSRSSWSSLLGQVLLGKSSAGFGRGLTTSPLSLLIQCAGRTRPQGHVSGFWVLGPGRAVKADFANMSQEVCYR
jgi:hypothetical protein